MKTCVMIAIDQESGDITVRECAPEEMMGDPAGQSFPSMEEALMAAAQMLTGETRQSPEEAKQSVMAGYNKAGNRPMVGV